MQYSTHLLRHLRFIIGKNIRVARTGQKMTLRKLSRLSGIPELLIDHYELGKNEITLEHMLRVGCVLGIDAIGLMEA